MNKEEEQKKEDLLETYRLYQSQDITKGIGESSKLIDVIIVLQDYYINNYSDIPSYKYHISTLATKTILNCISITKLLEGHLMSSETLNRKKKLLDIPGIHVLLRAQLETFLMFDFIYCQPQSEDEIEFRYSNWIYSGLLSRNEFVPLTESAKTKLEKDKIDISMLKKSIENSDFFNQFTPNQKRKLIVSGDPRLFNGWNKLIELSKIRQDNSFKLYRLFSSNAHTTGLSIINLNASLIEYKNTSKHGHLAMYISKLLLAVFIVKFKNALEPLKIRYEEFDKSIKNKIEFLFDVLIEQ